MLKWLPYPMVRIAAFFAGGVVAGICFSGLLSFRLVFGLLIFCLVSFLLIKHYSEENRFPFALGFFGLAAIFLFGLARLFLFTDWRDKNHFSTVNDEIVVYEAVVRSAPEEKSKLWRMEVEITAVKTKNLSLSAPRPASWRPATGKSLLYLSKSNFIPDIFRYGDKILVKGNLQEVKPPSNPGEFDFKRFLSFKNITHQQFARIEDVKFVSPASRKGFVYYSHRARAWSMRKLNEYIHGEDERAIAIALVLGVTDGIDNDLQNAYAASGAMHVLAVSGMHVGIIYAIILFLFKPLKKLRWSKWLVAITSLILLWAFAFVTGLSPSVLRAVTMFSFIALARPFGRQTNIYNTLAASVFVLLMYNPYLIMSVGFQLSYLAVLGIVYLQRPLYNLWEIENSVGDWVWQITCVSMAAQAATFALGLLYFHQFPTYFLISNLLVIPLSTLVLVMGIFLLLVSFFSSIASFTAMILEWLIRALNWIVFKTEALPFSLINDIHVTIFQCLVLMGIGIALILLFEFKSIKWLYVSFGLTLLCVFFQWNHFIHEVNQKQLIVYHINSHQAIEFIDRGQSYFTADSLLQLDRERIRFHIQPNRLVHGVSGIQSIAPLGVEVQGISYFRINNNTIGWIKKRKATFPKNAMIDYLIVSNNSLSKKLLSIVKTETIIFDGSNSTGYLKSLMEESTRRNIQSYSTKEQGAYIY